LEHYNSTEKTKYFFEFKKRNETLSSPFYNLVCVMTKVWVWWQKLLI